MKAPQGKVLKTPLQRLAMRFPCVLDLWEELNELKLRRLATARQIAKLEETIKKQNAQIDNLCAALKKEIEWRQAHSQNLDFHSVWAEEKSGDGDKNS